jgi:tRNA G18 (ribose-2'-O)-methylase SpoU
MDRKIILIAHNLRSCHNVGSILRTADGLGVTTVYLSGYTPYPAMDNDERLPHLAQKISRQIHKTALGAENSVTWEHAENIQELLDKLRRDGYVLAAIEQNDKSIKLPDYKPPKKIALLVGREVEGVEDEVLEEMDVILEIPMFGEKESFNVVQAAAMGLYKIKFG